MFGEGYQFATDDVPQPVSFKTEAVLDVVNLGILSEWGTQLCDATLASASEFVDKDCLAEKLFNLHFGEGIFSR